MVWDDGTTTVAWDKMGKFTYDQDTFNADGEVGTTIDLFDYLPSYGGSDDLLIGNAINFRPTLSNFWLTASHATVVIDVVSFLLEASIDNNTYTTIATLVDADLANSGNTAGFSVVESDTWVLGYRYWRITCTTVGAGNTLHGFVELYV